MNREDALEVMARWRGCSPNDIHVCGSSTCTAEECVELRELTSRERECVVGTPPPSVNILEEANSLVHGDRGAAYGHPLDDYTRTAALASALLSGKLREPITAEEMILVMCCVKLSRQVHAPKRDNMTDLAGYALCEQRAVEERARRQAL